MGEDREAGGRRAGSGREKGEIPLIADPARRQPAFPTDPEPGIGESLFTIFASLA